jgi:hypothetical protein
MGIPENEYDGFLDRLYELEDFQWSFGPFFLRLPIAYHLRARTPDKPSSRGFEKCLILAHRSDGGEHPFLLLGGYVQVSESGLKVIRNVSLDLIPFRQYPCIKLG